MKHALVRISRFSTPLCGGALRRPETEARAHRPPRHEWGLLHRDWGDSDSQTRVSRMVAGSADARDSGLLLHSASHSHLFGPVGTDREGARIPFATGWQLNPDLVATPRRGHSFIYYGQGAQLPCGAVQAGVVSPWT